ncbi:outer membrane lipoprotein LolB [Candidatus Blochmanniella vafra str. BVAF]|uniref:Outer-membrane lipoprotein LolB n=1 Tax=Blochmanniella vafra (strain BVAF) TaxID=859654 RepID=E8Q6Z7_BLOVB|nr:lipoprotein insertase outer membrane protein LolB [Candidatus Blochmannia vafer]ADV33744.1 outer membrane lipoprotein LolB [Candidatus Blochmannia vafer str. BVAF]
MYQNIYFFQLLNIAVLICTACVHNYDSVFEKKRLMNSWSMHQQLISKIFYYHIQGNIVYKVNSKQKMYLNFIWTQNDNNNCNIKLFNIFGLTIISISLKNGIIYVTSNLMFQDEEFKNNVRVWLTNTNFFKEQLQSWILGLPGYHSKYYLNSMGTLSKVNCLYDNKNICIFYRLYFTNNKPMLPKILEIHYEKYFIKLHINNWSM